MRRAAESRRVLGHDVHHRLDVGRRAGDDPQDLGRGRLLLQRLGHLAVPRLELREQPHVLDRDHRLVGERLQQLDLLVGERLDLGPPDGDRADGVTLAEHRDGQERREPAARCVRPADRYSGSVSDVGDLTDRRVEDRPARSPDADRRGKTRQITSSDLAAKVVMRRPGGRAPHPTDRRPESSAAEPHRALDDRVQHGLDVSRRARDHPQDLAGRRLLLEGLVTWRGP